MRTVDPSVSGRPLRQGGIVMAAFRSRIVPFALTLSTAVIFIAGCGTAGDQLRPDQQGGLSGDPLINGAAPGIGGSTPQNGTDGSNGSAGAGGATGSSGTNGTNGSDGANGSSGGSGTVGTTGATGPAGPAGPEGPAGPPGPVGASPFSLVQGNAVFTQGALGVGVTAPLAKLHVMEATDAMCIVRIESGATSPQYAGIDFVDRGKPHWGMGKDTLNDFYINDHGDRRFTIKAETGLFGIGTEAPVSRLDVRNGVISVTNGIGLTRVATGLTAGLDAGYLQLTGPDNNVLAGMGGSARGTVYVQNAAGARVAEMAVTPQGQGIIVADVIQAAVKNFCIDHPLDPANKLLVHTSVESSEMMNLYSGNVVTDANGFAEVRLPDWFDALNGDFRYQLTPIGQFAQCMIGEKLKGNRFVIRTDKPQVEVSWQVTAVRQDPWAMKHRSPVEVDKSSAEKGKLLRPDAYDRE